MNEGIHLDLDTWIVPGLPISVIIKERRLRWLGLNVTLPACAPVRPALCHTPCLPPQGQAILNSLLNSLGTCLNYPVSSTFSPHTPHGMASRRVGPEGWHNCKNGGLRVFKVYWGPQLILKIIQLFKA